jgi:hypothetical protein
MMTIIDGDFMKKTYQEIWNDRVERIRQEFMAQFDKKPLAASTIADEIGVCRQTVTKFMEGENVWPETLDKIEQWVRNKKRSRQ